MPGVMLHPQPCVRSKEAHKLKSLQVKPNKRHSLRDGFNAYFRALPGVHDLLVTVVRGIITRDLSTSPGVPGPHAFAVRIARPGQRLRRAGIARHTMHRIPPHVRDDRDTPLVARRDTIMISRNFCKTQEKS